MVTRAAAYLQARVAAWRTGTPESQAQVALVMLVIVAASFVVSVTAPEWMPLAAYFVWLLIAMMLLDFRALVVASRRRTGLPSMLSEAFLVDLRDRLQGQGKVPPLPEGWDSQSAMIASHGVTYAGDFLVAHLSEGRRQLELILVDVCGKGTGAGPAALQFSGALGGLIGALPPRELLLAANDFLIRQGDDEAFA